MFLCLVIYLLIKVTRYDTSVYLNRVGIRFKLQFLVVIGAMDFRALGLFIVALDFTCK